MAGPTVKLFKYIAPPTPRRLIDESVFILDFNTRKFITTGLDPADNFNTIIQIVTPSRYVKLTPEFLKKVFSLMGYVFSIILDPDFKRIIFLDTEYYKLSTMKYREDNMLVIESKIEKECRILLNRTDLLSLQNIEYSIFETIERKNKFVLPSILHQFDQISTYMKKIIEQPTTVEDISLKISNFQDGLIKASILDVEQSFISQLKLLASEQLAVDVVNKMEKDVSCVEEYSELTTFDLSPPNFISHQPEDLSQVQAQDQNDGPMFFNQFNTQPNMIQTTFAEFPAIPCKVKRKLF